MSLIICKDCGSSWSSRSELETHKRHEHKPYKCAICKKGFASVERLEKHIARLHPDGEQERHRCTICGTKYRWHHGASRCQAKCETYGGPVHKANFYYQEACKLSLAIDGTLSHTFKQLSCLENGILNRDGRAYLAALYNTSRESAKARAGRGRTEAGVHTISLQDVVAQYNAQNGECYYTGLNMTLAPHSDWRCSLERLDPEQGYTPTNIALICSEFNSPKQWSKDKIRRFLDLVEKEEEHGTIFSIPEKKSSKGVRHRRVISTDTHCLCNHCDQEKPLEDFTTRLSSGCKACQRLATQMKRSTPSGHFSKLLTTMRQASKSRGHAAPELTQQILIDLLNQQRGLCAYSGLKMNFGSIRELDWVCSVDRRDVSQGYKMDNVFLVCYEFNTMDMSGMSGKISPGVGSSGWSAAKMQFLLTHWKEAKETLRNETRS